jgi:acyl-CoA dehydrogenase
LGTLLSLVVFPIDHSYKQGPSDKLDHDIVQPMLTNSGLRQRLSKLSVVFMKPDDMIGRVELAFQQVLQTAELEKILHRAVRDGKLPNQPTRQALLDAAVATGILTAAQAQQLIEVDAAVADAIAVDEFRYEQLTGKSPSWLKKAQKVTETV